MFPVENTVYTCEYFCNHSETFRIMSGLHTSGYRKKSWEKVGFFGKNAVKSPLGLLCAPIFLWNSHKRKAGIIRRQMGILLISRNTQGGHHAGKSRDLRCQHRQTESSVPCGDGNPSPQSQGGGRRRPGEAHRGQSAAGAQRHPAL